MGAIADYYANSSSLAWVLNSKKDPRWNCSGHGGKLVVDKKLKELKSKLGNQPKDLEISASKTD
jgi:hypothetical protein